MIRVAWRLAVADARRAPARTLAVAGLLVAAAWLPTFVDAPAIVGGLLAVAVAFAAAVGAAALAEGRAVILERNGARTGLHTLIAVLSLLIPGVGALVVTVLCVALAGSGPGIGATFVVTVVMPVLAAPVAGWVTVHGRRFDGRMRIGPVGRRRSVVVAVAVVVCVVFLPLGLAVVAGYLLSGSWSQDRVRRVISVVLAFVALGFATVVVGGSRDWTDLGFALFFMIPVLVISVAILAVHVHGVVAERGGRLGPRFRLALAPLVLRRRVLAPLLALVTLAMAVAVTEGVVGASFGQREADRARTLPTITAVAGNDPRQVIVPVPPVDPGTLRKVANAQLVGSGASAVVIEEVGVGNAQVGSMPSNGSSGDFLRFVWTSENIDPVGLESRPSSTPKGKPVFTRSRWLGIVAPADLDLLSWGEATHPLAAGKLVVVDPSRSAADGTVAVTVGTRTRPMPTEIVDGMRGGYALPAALVSADTAARLSPFRTTARVVVVPTPGAQPQPTIPELVAIGRKIQTAAARLPVARPTGLNADQQSTLERFAGLIGPSLGDDSVIPGARHLTVWESGPLNDVPILAGTAGRARRSMQPLIILSVFVTLAVVFLALGATRRDDEVLAVQGAPGGFRSAVAAIQAGMVTTSAATLAAAAGIGIPAACFALYNRNADLPPIPLVVPGVVWVVLVAVPLGTVALAAVLPLLRTRGRGVPDTDAWFDTSV